MKKLPWFLLLVGAAGAPPIIYNAGHWWESAKQRVAPLLSLNTQADETSAAAPAATAAASTAPPSVTTAAQAGKNPSSAPAPAPRSKADQTSADLAEVLRFDVTPGWVMERWSWVSAGLSELPLQGYRVPLVTGTAEDDLAGSLTYYFNARQQVQRITLEGSTGDAGKLIRLLMSRYGFGRRLTNDPGLFRYEVPVPKGPVKSFLDVRLAQPNDAHRRFHVLLVIDRPE